MGTAGIMGHMFEGDGIVHDLTVQAGIVCAVLSMMFSLADLVMLCVPSVCRILSALNGTQLADPCVDSSSNWPLCRLSLRRS